MDLAGGKLGDPLRASQIVEQAEDSEDRVKKELLYEIHCFTLVKEDLFCF